MDDHPMARTQDPTARTSIRITVLPHKALCPTGAIVDALPGQRIVKALQAADIPIENACENSCACATCHVIVRKGLASLAPASDREEDMLDRAWGLCAQSRLACQAIVGDADLVIEIPKYSVNQVREGD